MAAKSWRLSFIDIDNSFSLSTGGTALFSYIVVRAPKGEAEPKYFEKGNEEAIKAMVGLPTANWQDIAEAIALNAEYDTYISCPSGTAKDYPTTYGGGYICKDGYYSFYNVTDPEEPNFLTSVNIGGESGSKSTITGSLSATGQDSVILTVSADNFASMTRLDLNYWGRTNGAAKGLYSYNLDKVNNSVNPYVDGVIQTGIKCGTIALVDTNYVITLGGVEATNDANNTEVPYINFADMVAFTKGDVLEAEVPAVISTLVTDTATSFTVNGVTVSYSGESVKARLTECLNIRSSCYGYIIQASPTETPTSIVISDIGYDKYQYDTKVNWAVADFAGLSNFTNSCIKGYIAFGNTAIKGIASYDSTTGTFTDVTDSFNTKSIAIAKKVSSGSTSLTLNKIFYLESGVFTEKTVDGEGNLKLYENLNFNTFTFSCTEEVYPGEETSGGTFTGSFSDIGKDSYGSNIYWPNVISDDAMSFVKVVPLKTMDNDVDENGFFSGTKIVDYYNNAETYNSTLKGTRYVTHLVEDNINSGLIGCAWRNEFETVLAEGWTEALNTRYWEVALFVECTGHNSFSTRLATLRATQSLSTVIAPYTITQAILDNPDTAIVAGRSTGISKFVNEFQVLDSFTGKKYWCSPIGSVGTNLLRIMDKKLGACSPYGTNDTANCGGVLNRTVLKAKWDIDDNTQKAFDKKGLNPIVLDKSSGTLTIMSGKTLQDPNNSTDWSYLAHSMAFDLCKRELYNDVMHPQIGKKNNPYWQKLRKEQMDNILEKRTTGNDPAWTEAVGICDDTINTASVKAAHGFALKVRVKVYPFSETVTLTFQNEAQSTIIS